jgi:hypothetical protein
MKMKKKTVLFTLISVFLLSAMTVTSIVAQPRIVGVSVDDWSKYGEITVDWSSSDPNATFPPPYWEWLVTINETEWMQYSVEGVSGTNVTLQVTEHFKNDTERIRSGWIDIDTGSSSQETNETTDMGIMIISANLDANDTIYSSPDWSDWKINYTVTRTYPGGARNTNHLKMTEEYSWSNGIAVYQNMSMNYYWDRSTGVLVEWSIEAANQTGDYLTTWSALMRITESNVWVIPEFPTWTSMLLILIVFTVATVIYKRRLTKTPIR